MLDEILDRLNNLPPEELKALEKEVNEAMPDQVWYPNSGPQTDAYFSKADILLYGGEPGGGKTGLLIGVALTQQKRSLLIRKQFTDLEGILDSVEAITGKQGLTRGNRPRYRSTDGRLVSFQGMGQTGEIDTSKQGNAFDGILVDEAAQLPENDVRLLIGWNRVGSGVPKNQRCRIILGSNPPVNPTGDWLGTFFAPWLDPKYINPAKFGELRWFYFNSEGKSVETQHTEEFEIDGFKYYPKSRTYIPAKLEDNPYINAKEYRKNLQTIPEPFRSQLLSGNFLAARTDQHNQIIPTSWVQAAIGRHEKRSLPPEGIPMCNIGLDCSGGGQDDACLSPRYDHYFSPLIKFRTSSNEAGEEMASEVIKTRRDRSDITIDMGGGYGSSAWRILRENIGTEYLTAYRGGEVAQKRTQDGKLTFTNLRTQAYWSLREALDPEQNGGSHIELPNDNRLLAGLTAPTFELQGVKIKAEPKDKVVQKLGFSPNEADAVAMSWFGGKKGLVPITQQRQSFSKALPTKMASQYDHRRNI